MIRRLEEYEQALDAACTAMPHPGMLAALWMRTAGGLPGGLSVYDCGSGVLLVVRRGAAVLLGRPGAASRRELAAFAPFAGIHCLYTSDDVQLPAADWSCQPLVWMAARTQSAPAARGASGHAVYLLSSYFAAAQLICGDESEETRNDFYAELCSRRNRGLGQVLALGERSAPAGCAVCSGPIPCPVPAERKHLPLLQRLRIRLKRSKAAPAEWLPTIYLSDVFVAPQYRGDGRGAALVQAALCKQGLPEETQQITVYCAPEMIPFYQSLRLQEGGRLRCWTSRNG